MASLNTLALRHRMAALQPRGIPVYMPRQPQPDRIATSIEMRRIAQMRHLRTRRRVVASNAAGRDGQPRSIPIGGPGRRRAKAHRQRGLCMHPGAKPCPLTATRFGRCDDHLTPQVLRSHGEHLLASVVEAGGTLTRGRHYETEQVRAPRGSPGLLVQPESGESFGERTARLIGDYRGETEVVD